MAHEVEHVRIGLVNALLAAYPPVVPDVPLRALRYSPNITLSFVLLNEDAADGSYVQSWEIENALRGVW